MIIDFHTHIFPDEISSATVAKLGESANIQPMTDGSESGLMRSMLYSAVSFSVSLPVITNPLKTHHINELQVQLSDVNPQIIRFGGIHPDSTDVYSELRFLKESGIKGIKIHPVYQKTDFDDIKYLRILDTAASLGLIIVSHAGKDIGFPGADRCSPVHIENALKQLGNIPLVLAHMGGWMQWDEAFERLSRYNVFFDTSFSIGTVQKKNSSGCHSFLNSEAAADIIHSVGSERFLFGTDSPWTDQRESVRIIQGLLLSEKEKKNILSDNAKKLLQI